MTIALPASRAAVGIVAVAVPAVRTRPPIISMMDLFLGYFSVFLYLFQIYQINSPAAVNATLTGSTMGAGAPETERRQHARARTTKPFGIFKDYSVVFSFIFFFSFSFLPQLMAAWILELLYFNRCCIFNCWCCFCFLQLFISPPFEDCDLHFALLF